MAISGPEPKRGGGEKAIGVFGGTVRLKDISGKDVLSPFPSLTLSAEFDGIDLGRLTRRLDFGEMTGILQGSITGCELFRKVPVRCSARFDASRNDVSRAETARPVAANPARITPSSDRGAPNAATGGTKNQSIARYPPATIDRASHRPTVALAPMISNR